MHKLKIIIITFVYFFSSFLKGTGGVAQAQQRQVDSLLTELRHNNNDNNEKLQTLNALSFNYSTIQLDSGIAVADRAIALAKKLNNQKELAAAYNNKALNIIERDNDSSAVALIQQALEINTILKNNRGIADNYYCSAYYKNNIGDPKSAKELVLKAIGIYENERYAVGLVWSNYLLGYILGNFNEVEKSKEFQLKGISIAQENGYDVGLAICYDGLAGYYWKASNYAKSFEFYNKAIEINKQIGSTLNSGVSFANLSNVYAAIGNYPKSLESALNALRFHEKGGCVYNQGYSLLNISEIYLKLNQFDKALEYAHRSVTILENISKVNWLCTAYSMLGRIYTLMLNPDSAFKYLGKGMDIAVSYGSGSLLGYSYTATGRAYREFQKYGLAINYFQKAFTLDTKLFGKVWAAEDLCDIGKCIMLAPDASLLEAGISPGLRYSTAINYFQQVIKDSADIEFIRDSYYGLSNIYEKQKNLKTSLEYYKKYIVLKDSISNSNNTQSIAKMQLQYDTDKKEQQITLLNKDKVLQQAELEKQKTTRNSFMGGFALVLLLAGVSFNRYRLKHKANKQIERTLDNLKNTQEQLVQQGKLASLGKMTSDVATEIKAPLTVVNRYTSDTDSLFEEYINAKTEEEKNKSLDKLQLNLEGINKHGKLADGIVKRILLSARSVSKEK